MRWLILLALSGMLVVGGLAVALARTGGDDGSAAQTGAYRGSQPPAQIELVDFALPDETGALVRAADLRGKVVVLTFLDSQCTESCPIIAVEIARAHDLLRASERERVVAVAISTDPEEDTPASVRAFLSRNRAHGKLRYLGGGEPASTLRPLWERFSILSSLESGEDTLHSAPVRIYDRDGVWVATLHAGADLTPTSLVHDIRVALEESSRG